VGLGLILGGATGNLIDRARLGYVVDFLDLYWRNHHWPTFNVADVGITVGVFLLLIDMVVAPKEPGDASRPAADR
jgi:signal peptidase II